MSATTRNRIYTKDVMIDIETLSTRPNAVIVSIGAIKFSRVGVTPELDEMDSFYTRVSRESCELLGMHVDPNTLEWWKKQDADIRYEALENPVDRLTIKDALSSLSKWFGRSQFIWGHGDDFDCVVLNEAFTICNMKVPWQFWNTRDTRTLFDIAGIRNSDLPANDKHHPIHDCYRQFIGVKKALSKLNI
jgi:hypothetical protein